MKSNKLNYAVAIGIAALSCIGGIAAAQSIVSHAVETEPKSYLEESYLEDNTPASGMCFSTANVVEEFEYDDAYCLVYDDADANMFEVEICVDLETYQLVQKAIREKRELIGSLVLNKEESHDGIEVFTFMPEPEFEMAAASANF